MLKDNFWAKAWNPYTMIRNKRSSERRRPRGKSTILMAEWEQHKDSN